MSVIAENYSTGGARDHVLANRNVIILLLAQALVGAQLPMVTVFTGLAGQSLASDMRWATLPIAMQGIGAMTTSLWLARLMQSSGRRAGFMIGVLAGATGAAICGYGLMLGSFPIFVAGAFFTGVYQAAQGFYRFAAMDAVAPSHKAKAMSYVLAGGLAAAVLGTQFGKMTSDIWVIPFLGTYALAVFINLAGLLLFSFLEMPVRKSVGGKAAQGRSYRQLLADPLIRNAILCASAAYGVMLLVMSSTPLAVVGFGCTHGEAADIIMVHVLSMFAPSFITGSLIGKLGARRVSGIGLALLAIAAGINLSGVAVLNFYVSLSVLGLGWNFAFLGATSLLSAAHRPDEQGRVQGLNDMIVAGTMAVASLGSGLVMNASGNSVSSGWMTTNLAVFPIIAIAALSLISIAPLGLRSEGRKMRPRAITTA